MPHPVQGAPVRRRRRPRCYILEGFDAHTAPVFEQAIQAELDASRPRLIVDGEKLTYISAWLASASSWGSSSRSASRARPQDLWSQPQGSSRSSRFWASRPSTTWSTRCPMPSSASRPAPPGRHERHDLLERTLTLTVPSATGRIWPDQDFVVNVGLQAGPGDDDVEQARARGGRGLRHRHRACARDDSNKEVIVRATFDAATLRIEVVDEGQG